MRLALFLLSLCFFLACSPEKPFPTFDLKHEEPIGWNKKKACTLEIDGESGKTILGARAKLRGGFSAKFYKHSFTIELESGQSLLGLPINDDWILNANYIDKTMMRHKLAYDIFRDMAENNEAPRSAYVQLMVNSKYEGLYVLMEKVNAGYLGLNKKDSLAMLFKDPPVFRVEDKASVADTANYFEQKYPKMKKKDHSSYLLELRELILTADDDLFEKEIGSWVDLDNIIDWHLFILFSNNGDGILKNFYLYKKDSATPFRVCLWDYDHSFGRDGDNELNMAERLADPERNILLKRLKESNANNYNERMKERWQELRGSFYSEKYFLDLIETNHSVIKNEAGKNFGRWPVDSEDYFDANSYEEELEILRTYFKKRIPELDAMFE
ncbi:MAG: CotH kinase family protein [Flavobacteriales bacterium]|nr:CotH kinase family protein [Flavobacteriales bacterium]